MTEKVQTERTPSNTPGRAGVRAWGPDADGEVTSLGSLEAAVMRVLWDAVAPLNANRVGEILLYERRAAGLEPFPFATITTTLRRLTEKGVVASAKDGARTPLYRPAVGRAELAARVLHNASLTLLGRPLFDLIAGLDAARGGPTGDPMLDGLSHHLDCQAQKGKRS